VAQSRGSRSQYWTLHCRYSVIQGAASFEGAHSPRASESSIAKTIAINGGALL